MEELIEKLEKLKDLIQIENEVDVESSVEIIIEAIQALQQREGEWISVEDRLPEPKQFVLVYGILNKEVGKDDTKPSIGLVMWNVPMASDCKDEDQYSMWYTDITHWISLPTPPNK